MKLDYESLTPPEKVLITLIYERGGQYPKCFLYGDDLLAGQALVERGWMLLEQRPIEISRRRVKRLHFVMSVATWHYMTMRRQLRKAVG